MGDDLITNNTGAAGQGDDQAQPSSDTTEADAQALLELAKQLDSEADEIDQIVAEASEQMVEETKEEVATLEKAASDAEELEKEISTATGGQNETAGNSGADQTPNY